ncbi:MAG: hypothetical protein EON59_08020 [Alphaproteobacteria bacterium]|nr:MAG: hypothetical protein EON59_08020 [Alphaproteobacteria bacterium]
MSKTYVDGINVPHPKGEPKDAADAQIFHQGRTAALNGIGEDDAPFDQGSDERKLWSKGWASVER